MNRILSAGFRAITVLAAMGGAVLASAPAKAPAEQTVTVCMEGGIGSASVPARWLASHMFSGIGVTIGWREGLRGCPSDGIRVTLGYSTPVSFKPGALAYARPYEGTRVWVFWDRIKHNYDQAMVPIVLAHVLVHEITHILQNVCRHSDQGIMKARWDVADYSQMARKPLEFSNEDIDLIYRGMAARSARVLVAMTTAPKTVHTENTSAN